MGRVLTETSFTLNRVMAFLLLALTAMVFASSCEPSVVKDTKRPAKVKIAAYFWPGSYWVDVAFDKGWFKEAGLDVARVDTNADYFSSQEQLVTGKLDVVSFTYFDFVQANAQGKDLVAIACTDVSDGADSLIVQKNIHSARDLEGKKVGVTPGTYLEFIFRKIVAMESVDLSKIQTVEIHAEEADEAMKRLDLAGVMTWEPVCSKAVSLNNAKRLYTTADLNTMIVGVLSLRKQFVNDQQEEVFKILQVWNRSTQYLEDHREESYAIVSRLNHKSINDVRNLAKTDRILNCRDNKLVFDYGSGAESLFGVWRQINDFLIDKRLVDRSIDSSEHLDSSFLLRLK